MTCWSTCQKSNSRITTAPHTSRGTCNSPGIIFKHFFRFKQINGFYLIVSFLISFLFIFIFNFFGTKTFNLTLKCLTNDFPNSIELLHCNNRCTGTLYLGNGQVVFIAYINFFKKLIATFSLNFITFDNNLIIGISGFETDTYTKCMMSFICMGTKPT